MKVIFQREDGGKVFESNDENISDLLAILKETKGIKIGMVEYEVLKYEIEYFRHPKRGEMERELHITIHPKYM
ncbi:hypothetical protein COL24_23980 [Bacillus toyonensis]|uniref:hypothetical protein n=1 Tax=Bacillus toyonensis TaxID=155322 RepID=UPI000BF15210|nr:hypothetical protein [Bacillus toyonensis]PEL01017.1 hypothetical protein CN606_18965 [Bacillus toyonensis]PEO26963.1 hypothetical protein CN589_19285 [Bacillus toyonensis]PFX37316.1 hypothetical protein COL24_23980 [Bacillus toyonensis]PFY03369.1 hypothetical protein COL45_09980 [Bacillus toyonensis]PGC12860.1 hypothetical protein COL99_13310 [Bacillus toyonensis]